MEIKIPISTALQQDMDIELVLECLDPVSRDKGIRRFITLYRNTIYLTADGIYYRLVKSHLIPQRKQQLMEAFIHYLLSANGKGQLKLSYFLTPSGSVLEREEEKFGLERLHDDVIGDEPTHYENKRPSLKYWVYVQAVFFIRAYIVCDAVRDRDEHILRSFVWGDNPGCQGMISAWLYENLADREAKTDRELSDSQAFSLKNIKEKVTEETCNDLFNALRTDERVMKPLINYKYGMSFYKYFRNFCLKPYLIEKFLGKQVPNPVFSEKVVSSDDINEYYVKEDNSLLSNDKLLEREEMLSRVSNTGRKVREKSIVRSMDSLDDNGHDPESNDTPEGLFEESDKKKKLEIILKELEKRHGKNQADAIRLSLEGMSVSDIAIRLDISENAFTTRKSYALKHAKEIRKELENKGLLV